MRNSGQKGFAVTRRQFLATAASVPLAAPVALAADKKVLWLFGRKANGEGATWTNTPPGVKRLELQGNNLRVEFDGPLPGGGLAFSGTFEVAPDASGELHVVKGGGRADRLQARLAPGLTLQVPGTPNLLEIVSNDRADLAREGLGFIIRRSSLTNAIGWLSFIEDAFHKKAGRTEFLSAWPAEMVVTLDYGDGFGEEEEPQVRVKRLRGESRNTQFVVEDSFAAAENANVKTHSQNFTLEELRAGATSGSAILRPAAGYYLIQPDILDPVRANLPGNDLLYEFALVNGKLRIDWSRRLQWVGDGSEPAGLLAFRLLDENGAPGGVVAKSFPLTRRDGIHTALKQADTAETWEKTIAAITLDGGTVDGMLRRIDPAAIPAASYRGASMSPPYWLTPATTGAHPRVPFDRVAPEEVHGLNTAVYLLNNGGQGADACRLETERVERRVPNESPLFTLPALKLKTALWKVVAYHEARDLSVGVSEQAIKKEVMVRESKPLVGAPDWFGVPLIATSYAVANMSGHLRGEQRILRRTVDWLRRLDAQFTSRTVFGTPDADRATSSDGFEVTPSEVPFHALLPLPPSIANSPLEVQGDGARMVADVSSYVHGGDRVDTKLRDLRANLTSAAAEAYVLKFRNFSNFWNGVGTLSGTVLLARDALREFLYSQIVESPRGPFFAAALASANGVLSRLEQRFDTSFQPVRTIVAAADVEHFKKMWRDGVEPGSVAPELWSAFRRELSWPEFYSRLGAEFFAEAALRAVDTVHNLADETNPRFAMLSGIIRPGLTGPQLAAMWLNSGVDPALWRLFCEFLLQPATPALYRRALQTLFSRPASKFTVPDPFTADSNKPLPAGLELAIDGAPVKAIAPYKTLQELAERTNEAIGSLGFSGSVRASAQRLEDGNYHLVVDTDGPHRVRLQSAAGAEVLQALPPLLAVDSAVVGQLYEFVQPFTTKFDSEYFDVPLDGFLSSVTQGVDGLFAALERLWAAGPHAGNALAAAKWRDLHARYSPALTADVYRRLLANAGDEKTVVDLFNEAAGAAARQIKRLAELRSEPPPYVFFTKKFEIREEKPNPEDEWPWRRTFELCALGGLKKWTFFLDDRDSSVIVKLTADRTLGQILTEIHQQYRANERKNPLGIPVSSGESVEKSLERFISRLDPDLIDPAWRGLLIIRPTADISGDEQLADLCGFSHVGAEYAAVGGHDLRHSALDVYALISKSAEPEPVDVRTDVALTVEKFEARIKHSRLVAGEVLLHFDPRNVWGKEVANYALRIRGSVSKDPKTEGHHPGSGDEPSSFEFAATLEPPKTIPIDLAFLKAITLRSVRVGRSRGQTSLDIDASMDMQKVSLGGFELGELATLNLRNFRLLVPRTSGGKATPLGRRRLLDFEFPAITFDFGGLKPFSLAGLNLKPIGIGIFRRRGITPDILGSRYQWIGSAPQFDLDLDFSFLRCEVDFGKLPQLGLAQVGRLDLEILIGFYSRNGSPVGAPVFAVGGLDARNIKVDLFRILTLEIERLFLRKARLQNENDASALLVNNARLSILNWPLLGKEGFSLLLIHDSAGRRRATAAAIKDPVTGSFLTIRWAVVANGISISPEILNALIDNPLDQPVNPVATFVEIPPDQGQPVRVAGRFEDSSSWLVGASFQLGDIVPKGAFILHDQHYYGISLTAAWMKELIGSERLTLAYMPGASRQEDRFRTSFRIPKLDLIAGLKSGEIAIEWSVSWDYLLDFGFPWRASGGYQWERSFSVPMGTYEAKFGFYFEKKSEQLAAGAGLVKYSAGVGFYVGYRWEVDAGIAWARAGIGVFAVLQGTVSMLTQSTQLIGSVRELVVTGVIGIYAYGEGGVDVWILSSRFRVSVQAAISGTLHYIPDGACALTYEAMLAAHYHASTRVGCGPFSWEFTVSGSIDIGVSGRLALT